MGSKRNFHDVQREFNDISKKIRCELESAGFSNITAIDGVCDGDSWVYLNVECSDIDGTIETRNRFIGIVEGCIQEYLFERYYSECSIFPKDDSYFISAQWEFSGDLCQ